MSSNNQVSPTSSLTMLDKENEQAPQPSALDNTQKSSIAKSLPPPASDPIIPTSSPSHSDKPRDPPDRIALRVNTSTNKEDLPQNSSLLKDASPKTPGVWSMSPLDHDIPELGRSNKNTAQLDSWLHERSDRKLGIPEVLEKKKWN